MVAAGFHPIPYSTAFIFALWKLVPVPENYVVNADGWFLAHLRHNKTAGFRFRGGAVMQRTSPPYAD
jgi:hypothetical protein